MSFRPAETLTTERLTLRRPTLEDAGAIFDGYAQDPDVSHYTSWTPHASVETTQQFLGEAIEAWNGNARFVWIVDQTTSGELLGGIEVRVEDHRAEIGYVFRRSAWGRGYATEAAQAVVDHAFCAPGIWRVWAYCYVDHAASVRVLEKCGMQREGRVHRGFVFPNLSDQPDDVFLYAITKLGSRHGAAPPTGERVGCVTRPPLNERNGPQ